MGLGVLAQQRETMRAAANAAEEALKQWSKTILEGIRPPSGPYAFFHHNAHALERLKDVRRTLERLYEGRTTLRVLDEQERALIPSDWPGGTPFPDNIQAVMKQSHEVNEHVKMDFEVLYMFGNILLDQWSLCVAYAAGLPKPADFTFLGLVQCLEDQGFSGPLTELWTRHAPDMLWLNGQIRFYRNRFVVHADRPWQRGNTRSTFGHEYALFVPSPPGWLADEEIERKIKALLPLAPQWLQQARDDYWEKANARALLARLLDHLGEIQSKSDREAVLRFVGQFGTTTPTFQVVGARVLKFIAEATGCMDLITKSNLSSVNLGAPVA